MKTYETTYIFTSKMELRDAEDLSKELQTQITQKEGVVLKSDRTAAQVLAYPIKRESSGYFTTVTFQIEGDKVKGLDEGWSKNQKILRHITTIKKPVKVGKKERTRRFPFFKTDVESAFKRPADHKATEKVNLEEIEKKLEEI